VRRRAGGKKKDSHFKSPWVGVKNKTKEVERKKACRVQRIFLDINPEIIKMDNKTEKQT